MTGMTAPAPRAALIERLRTLLAHEDVTREVSMFGGTAFMVGEKLLVSALKGGGMLVRVPADRHDELLERRGASRPEMGAGRSMGPGWIEIDATTLADDDELASWIALALAHNRTLPTKKR